MTDTAQDLPVPPSPESGHSSEDGGSDSAAAGVRLAVGLAIGIAATVAVAATEYHRFAALIGWDVVALTFVGWTWASVMGLDAQETAVHATREEPTRTASHLIILGAAVASLVGVGFLLFASGGNHRDQVLAAGVALVSVVVSWFAVHTLFALGYARRYYTGPDGGISFNQSEPPRYSDFAYVAFTVGMSFAISDTNVESSEIRSTVLRHALLSYVFGSVILASVVNLIAGL